MKGTNLGELEEIILLVVASLFDNAYGPLIKQEIELKCNRSITISTVHNVLQRLQEKDYLQSRYSYGVRAISIGKQSRIERETLAIHSQRCFQPINDQSSNFHIKNTQVVLSPGSMGKYRRGPDGNVRTGFP